MFKKGPQGSRYANQKGSNQAAKLSTIKYGTVGKKRALDDLYLVEELKQYGRPKRMRYATATRDIDADYINCNQL